MNSNCENLRGYWFMIVVRDVDYDYKFDLEYSLALMCDSLLGYAYIYHDRDNSKTKHYHIIVHTRKQKTLKTMASIFAVPVCDIELVDIPNKALRYLIHADSEEKEKYEIEDVETNISNYELICSNYAKIKEKDNVMLYCLNLIKSNNIKSWAMFVDVCATTCPALLGDIMRKYCYSLTQYINSKNK